MFKIFIKEKIIMKVNPYLHFAGNCADAITFYESVFGIKAENVFRHKDLPPMEGYPSDPSTENFIVHACMNFGEKNGMHGWMMSDWPQAKTGTNVSISVAYDTAEEAKAVFAKLKDGGKVEQEIDKTFWSECWGSLTDKFGIMWQITVKD